MCIAKYQFYTTAQFENTMSHFVYYADVTVLLCVQTHTVDAEPGQRGAVRELPGGDGRDVFAGRRP